MVEAVVDVAAEEEDVARGSMMAVEMTDMGSGDMNQVVGLDSGHDGKNDDESNLQFLSSLGCRTCFMFFNVGILNFLLTQWTDLFLSLF